MHNLNLQHRASHRPGVPVDQNYTYCPGFLLSVWPLAHLTAWLSNCRVAGTTPAWCCIEMNKTYLRYELSETFGVVASPQSNVVYDSTGNLAISAALHDVAVWNLRQCSLVRRVSCGVHSTFDRRGGGGGGRARGRGEIPQFAPFFIISFALLILVEHLVLC